MRPNALRLYPFSDLPFIRISSKHVFRRKREIIEEQYTIEQSNVSENLSFSFPSFVSDSPDSPDEFVSAKQDFGKTSKEKLHPR